MKVDVVMLTKNSEKYLRSCLDSLYSNVPVNRLIIVDGGSEDDTIQILKSYPRVLVLEDRGGTRATARQKGIEVVETDWFLFLDSDVVLCQGWFEKVVKLLAHDVGAVQGVDISNHDELIEVNKLIHRRAVNLPIIKKSLNYGLPVIDGAFMGDTLVRKDAIKGIRIPSLLHVYEDRFIRSYIEERGYRWLITRDAYCLHYSHKKLLDAYYLGFVDAYAGYINLNESFKNLFSSIPSLLPALIDEPELATKCLGLLIHNVAGSICGHLHAKGRHDANLLNKLDKY